MSDADRTGDRGEPEVRGIRRIVVALDASPDSLAALEASAELAASLGAELSGLYVEDVNLLRVVARKETTEIDLLSGRRRPLGLRDLERQLRVQASRARRTLERTAVGLSVRWSFRTARGRPSHELQAESADLVTVGVRGHGVGRGPGSTVLRLLDATGLPVLVTRRGARLGRSVFVLHDGGRAGDRALETATYLALQRDAPMVVLMAAPADRGPETESARVRERMETVGRTAGRTPETRTRWLATAEAQSILAALRHERCGLLVLPRSGPVSDLHLLLRQAHCPVLVVD